MVRIRQLFVITGIALSALGLSAVPAHGQADDQEITAEETFHRIQLFETLRDKMPAAVNARKWEEAFLGDANGVVHPQYIATLFRDYLKAGAANQPKIVKWVEAIASELVARGDGDMLLLLASHYVRHHTDVSFQSFFAGQRIGFGKKIEDLGAIIKKTMTRMPPAEQRAFKESFAAAIAATLVNHCNEDGAKPECNPNPDLALAVMGYRLLSDFAQGTGTDAHASTDAALRVMRDHLDKYRFKAEDLAGLFTQDGIRDFERVTSSYVAPSQSPVMMLFEIGMRVEPQVGDSLRGLFISYLKENANAAYGVMLYTRTYDIANRQREAGLSSTIAQQTTAREWQMALGDQLNMEQLKTIYKAHYTSPTPGARYLFAAALTKRLSTQEQAQMPALFTQLLKQTAAKPDAFYRLMDDFKDNSQYRQALLAFQPTLKPAQVAAHFDYLAGIYIHTTNIGQTIDSNMRIIDLITTNAQGPAANRMTSTAFRAAILKYVGLVAKDGEKSYQLAKLVATANNSGWDKLIDKGFIMALRKRLPLNPHLVDATLVSVIEVQELRAGIEARLAAQERAARRAWKPVIRRNP